MMPPRGPGRPWSCPSGSARRETPGAMQLPPRHWQAGRPRAGGTQWVHRDLKFKLAAQAGAALASWQLASAVSRLRPRNKPDLT
jgi:hypothetical protein